LSRKVENEAEGGGPLEWPGRGVGGRGGLGAAWTARRPAWHRPHEHTDYSGHASRTGCSEARQEPST